MSIASVLPKTGQASVAMQSSDACEEIGYQAPQSDLTIDQASFDQLLRWLGPDPEAAGHEYELIRRKLTVMFTCRGCVFPEDMVDETFNRVARKLPQIKQSYVGSPVRYFYGVARNIYKEYFHTISAQHFPPAPTVKEDLEEMLQHLDDALSKLERTDRELILNYYRGEGRDRIDHRKALAKQMGLQLNGLRLRVYRIRSQLRAYISAEGRVDSMC